jgi:hypothetical protein
MVVSLTTTPPYIYLSLSLSLCITCLELRELTGDLASTDT